MGAFIGIYFGMNEVLHMITFHDVVCFILSRDGKT